MTNGQMKPRMNAVILEISMPRLLILAIPLISLSASARETKPIGWPAGVEAKINEAIAIKKAAFKKSPTMRSLAVRILRFSPSVSMKSQPHSPQPVLSPRSGSTKTLI